MIKKIMPISLLVLSLTGCVTPTTYISEQEAYAERNQEKQRFELNSSEWGNANYEVFWAQPSNKKVACKVPVDIGYKENPSFKTFWDGRCKDGYANGLGRVISLVEGGHVEQIIDVDFSNDDAQYPMVSRDYLLRKTIRGVVKNPLTQSFFFAGIIEDLVENSDGMAYKNELLTYSNPSTHTSCVVKANSLKSTFLIHAQVKGTSVNVQTLEPSIVPKDDDAADVYWYGDIQSPGVHKVRYKNGQVRQIRYNQGRWENVSIRSDGNYWSEFDYVYNNDVVPALTVAQNAAQQASEVEQRYLYELNRKKGNNAAPPKGLDRYTYYEILDFYDGFEQKARATAQAEHERKNAEREAYIAEQQRKTAETQAAVAAFNQGLRDTANTLNDIAQQNRVRFTNCYSSYGITNCYSY